MNATIASRAWRAAALAWAGLHAAAHADLDEAGAVRLALSRPGFVQAQEGRLDVARSHRDEIGAWQDPTLTVERDRVRAADGRVTETVVGLSQPLDVWGVRRFRADAATHRIEGARLDIERRRAQAAAEARRAFAEALHREQAHAALSRWQSRIEGALATVARLQQAGEASGFDRRRMEREARVAASRLAAARADLARAREELAALVARQAAELGRLAGDLVPADPPALAALREQLPRRPDLAALGTEVLARESDRRAAERARLPEITLTVGAKRIEETGQRDNGVVLGASVPLPIFEGGRAALARARAEERIAAAERELLLERAQARLAGLWEQSAQLRRAARDLEASLPASADLSRIAETAYRAGEGGVLDLLDAYRGEQEAHAAFLELALRARHARIELDALTGATP